MWIRKGLICRPNNKWWNKTHCYCPTPYVMSDRIRVFYAAWDDGKVGRITFIDLDKLDPSIILYQAEDFVLDKGQPSTFDFDGVGPSYVIEFDENIVMYYYGFQRTSDIAATLVFCGVAFSSDSGLTFKRLQETPILDRCINEMDLRSSVSVLVEGEIFKFWYTANIGGWTGTKGKLFSKDKYPNYSIRYIESRDGLTFEGNGAVCLPLEGDEFALGRPWVIKEDGIYKMWYSKRGVSSLYRIGYAESKDGVEWTRLDNNEEVQLFGEAGEWESEMVCFPAIFDVNDKRYMLYNGNKHGKDGFGLAVWE